MDHVTLHVPLVFFLLLSVHDSTFSCNFSSKKVQENMGGRVAFLSLPPSQLVLVNKKENKMFYDILWTNLLLPLLLLRWWRRWKEDYYDDHRDNRYYGWKRSQGTLCFKTAVVSLVNAMLMKELLVHRSCRENGGIKVDDFFSTTFPCRTHIRQTLTAYFVDECKMLFMNVFERMKERG